MRLAQTQVWPALRYFEAIAPLTAIAISASSKTMNGALPLSSRRLRPPGAYCASPMTVFVKEAVVRVTCRIPKHVKSRLQRSFVVNSRPIILYHSLRQHQGCFGDRLAVSIHHLAVTDFVCHPLYILKRQHDQDRCWHVQGGEKPEVRGEPCNYVLLYRLSGD